MVAPPVVRRAHPAFWVFPNINQALQEAAQTLLDWSYDQIEHHHPIPLGWVGHLSMRAMDRNRGMAFQTISARLLVPTTAPTPDDTRFQGTEIILSNAPITALLAPHITPLWPWQRSLLKQRLYDRAWTHLKHRGSAHARLAAHRHTTTPETHP